MMTEFTVYGIPGSPYLRAVLLGLHEKAETWRLAALAVGEHRREDHLRRHPFGRIPAIEHRGLCLYETQAILRYLDRIIREPALTPSDPVAEARMNQLCGITDWYVMPYISAGITFGRIVAPKFGFPTDEQKIAASVPNASICVAEIARLLGNQPFMAGDRISLADLMLAPHMAMLAETPEGESMLGDYAALSAWIDRMRHRPSMVKTEWDRLLEASAATDRDGP